MTRKEFIKRVEEMGFTVEMNKPLKVIFISSKYGTFARIDDNNEFKIDTFYQGGNSPMTEELFDLIVEYAKTPIEDREEPKKYRLRAEGAPEGWNYLNRTPHVISANDYELPLLIITRIYLENQTSFTEKEIAELPEWCQALERIEVEE